MDIYIIMIIGIVILILIGVLAIILTREREKEYKKTGKYPEGHFMGLGVAIGIGPGIAIGVAMNNVAIGIAIGAGMGIAVGSALEAKNKDKLRALTKKEKRMKKWMSIIGLVILLLGVAVLGVVWYSIFKRI